MKDYQQNAYLRPFLRFAIAFAIVLALIGSSVAVANYVYGIIHTHQLDLEHEAQAAALSAKIDADEKAAADQQQYLAATATVSLSNAGSSTAYLWTETPDGTNADGSPVWTYNAVCSAAPGQTCQATVYVHRGIQVRGTTSPWSSDNPNWPWQDVSEDGLALTAHDVTPIVAPTTQALNTLPPTSARAASAQQQGPLPASEVLPLLRGTSALTVSTNPDGHTAYVTVPDTPASGTADANRIISGQLADGRWVVFVPLASGSPGVGDIYSLAWVWINGRARFIGEVPAENNGLGQLSTSIRNGEIYISWPVCCPNAIRTKVNTLEGIRFRLLSDATS